MTWSLPPVEPLEIRERGVQAMGPSAVRFRLGGVPAEVEAWRPDILRLRIGVSRGPDYGFLVQSPGAPLEAEILPEAYSFKTGAVSLRLDFAPSLRLTLSRAGVPLLASSEDGHIRGGLRIPALGRSGGAWVVAFALGSGEPVYGLGEKFGPLNRRGGAFACWNEDALGVNAEASYKNVPLAWSPRGWGLFVHTPARTLHGVGYAPWSHRTYILLVEDEALDLFFLAGTPLEILEAYTWLTGRPPLVPPWSYGVWWSRCYYRTPEEALGVARELRGRDIPGDVLVLDGRAWLEVATRCTLEWDPSRYPDPEGFIRELKGLGFRVCLWEYPYVSVHSPLFAELAAKGYFLKDAQGNPLVYRWDPEPFGEVLTPLPPSGILDFTNPEAVRWWQERHQALLAQGVDVMKTDFGEQVPREARAHNGDTGSRLHNPYALLYNQSVYGATPEGLVFARSGYVGSQRYPVHWGGDPQADWEGLAASIRGGLSWGLSGGAYYAHDVGGFYGNPDPGLYLRWVQAATFFSHMRFHGMGPREPWHFGPEIGGAVRLWLRLRMRLVPYLAHLAQQAAATGQPLARALPLVYPEDPFAHGFDTQFLLGDILVAPVLRPEGRVEVYLPEGVWQDLWTGRSWQGPELLRLHVPLEQIPLFARRGARLLLAREAKNRVEALPEAEVVSVRGCRKRVVFLRDEL